jgi:hypothetical protein
LQASLVSVLDRMRTQLDRATALDSIWPWIAQFASNLPIMAENYSYSRIAQVNKHKHVRWICTTQACQDCRDRAMTLVPIRRFHYADLVHHSECMDRLEVAPI